MKIAVLSGKGGTGKTMVAASLAMVIPGCQYLDCDIEEPNGFIFLKPQVTESEDVNVLVPEVREDHCNRCGSCAKICQFNAIAVTSKKVFVFPELCHHCGACLLVCQSFALTEICRKIGVIESTVHNQFVQGRLNIGEPAGLPIIAGLKKRINPNRTTILDCSPGSACAVVRSLEGCDYALLVTEPTPFGLHDLKLAVELVRKMRIPAGIVLNKSGSANQDIESYCNHECLPILMEIPFSREIAEHYSQGQLPVQGSEHWQDLFKMLHWRIGEEVSHEANRFCQR